MAFFVTAGCGGEPPRSDPSAGRQLDFTHAVTFLDESGSDRLTIRVAVADTESKRSLGLMDVRTLGSDEGMIFLFERNEPLSFWMANTPLPLDMIFVDEHWRIVRIHTDTQPYSTQSYTSGQPARYVVEVNAGFCRRHDIREGQFIRFHDPIS